MNGKVIFIHVPKNAGTSINTALRPYGMRKLLTRKEHRTFNNEGLVTFGHYSIKYLIQEGYVSMNFFDEAFVFGISRDLFDRFTSLFKYLKLHRRVPKGITFEEFCYTVRDNDIPPVGPYNFKGLSQCNNQVDWLFEMGESTCDFIGSVETLQKDFAEITKQAGLPKIKLPFLNHVPKKSKLYTEETRQIVAEIYERDIKLLGYGI